MRSQSEPTIKISKPPEARENTSDQVTIGCSCTFTGTILEGCVTFKLQLQSKLEKTPLQVPLSDTTIVAP